MQRPNDLFLPDLCQIRSVFVLVMSGELLAFVLVLVAPGADAWQTLALASLFVQWVVLCSAAVLCSLRPLLAGMTDAVAGTLSYGLILLITGVVALLGHWLLEPVAADGERMAFVLRSLAVAAIVALVVLRYLYVVHAWHRRLESEAQARIDALQARIQPHFLFNSLNTIASMIPTAPAVAEAAVEDLADLFRASLAGDERLVPLGEELQLARGYLHMERLRLGERLQADWRVEALPADALIPPLTLQPLLENAVYYGIEPRLDGGRIEIDGERKGDRLRLRIRNPRPQQAGGPRRAGHGMAQANIRERLALAFGKAASLTLRESGEDYQVELLLPYRRGGR